MAKKKTQAKKSSSRPPRPNMAQRADRYELYGQSVQNPSNEVEFFDMVYRATYGRTPQVLREDFCGTFAVCCDWVRQGPARRAVGVDLDPEPLDWGREHHLSRLTAAQQARITLCQEDVRTAHRTRADILAAQNFSFWIFKTRPELLAYFKAARAHVAEQGMMVLDMMGGYECFEEKHEDLRKINRQVTYVWEQHSFNPINHDASFYIHFRFSDGSELPRAFAYHWRFWSLPEVCELLGEAGFAQTQIYWEAEDEDGEGTGAFHRATSARSDPAWLAYVVAIP